MVDHAGFNRPYYGPTGQFLYPFQSLTSFVDSLGNAVLRPDGAAQYIRPVVLCSTPIILPSSGSIGNNGALSGITALNSTYLDGCWMNFPTGAVFAGSPNASYFVIMSSPTAGQIFQNTLSNGQPTLPSSPTPFTNTTGPGAYTQTAGSNVTVLTVLLPSTVTIGPNGAVRVYTVSSNDLNAGTKNGTIVFNSGSGVQTFSESTVNATATSLHLIGNRGVTNRQVTASGSGLASAVSPPFITSADTTSNNTCKLGLTIQNAASNFAQYDQLCIELIYGP